MQAFLRNIFSPRRSLQDCAPQEGSEELAEPLRTLRLFHYLGWIAKRWDHDEQFRKTFPFFATERHWETVLQDVENQKAELEALGLLQF